MKLITVTFFAALFITSGCTRKDLNTGPSGVLERYIETSFSAQGVEAKKKLEELLTGDTQQRLMAWSDEQFRAAFIENKKKFQGLKILEVKKVNDSESVLTYELSFTEGDPDKTVRITQRKLATVVKVDSEWKIKEVRSLRESIEYLKEFSLP